MHGSLQVRIAEHWYWMAIARRKARTFRSLFADLEIEPTSNRAMIRQAFKRMALKTHPDKEGGANEKYQKIDEAYRKLLDVVSGQRPCARSKVSLSSEVLCWRMLEIN